MPAQHGPTPEAYGDELVMHRCPLDDRRMATKLDKLVAVQQPQETGMINAREGPLLIAYKQVERSPTERRDLFRLGSTEQLGTVIDS
jgi:hypothetical protein